MDRRKTLKTLFAGTAIAAIAGGTTSCEQTDTVDAASVASEPTGYGLRLPHEIAHDQRIANSDFFTADELATIGILGNIIAPGEDGEPSATETGLEEFVEFMALDQPDNHQTKLRGGLAWLNIESARRFEGKTFAELSPEQRIEIVDDIAYPEAEGTPMEVGARFFDHLRSLTLTCYFTSRKGMMDALGYQGNQPNVWDGVPEDVMAKHGMEYDPKYLPMYVNQERRAEIAQWDDDKNLLNNA